MTLSNRITERLEGMLGSEDPAWVLHAAELMFTLERSVWFPLVSRLSEITALAYPLEIARGLQGWDRWDLAAMAGVSIQQVARWEVGEPLSLRLAHEMACLFTRREGRNLPERRFIAKFFLKPPTPRPTMSTLDKQPWHELTLECDAPGCDVTEVFRGHDFGDAERRARADRWRLDPDHWCYCPRHRQHRSMRPPTPPRQTSMFGGVQ